MKLHIRRGVVRVDGEVVVSGPKTAGSVRTVAIPPHLKPVLRDHLAHHAQPGRDGLVFPARGGGYLAESTLRKVYHPARAKAGREDLAWHHLRHTGAVLAAATGATLAELMARLGHSTPQAAMRYQHAASDRDVVIAAALSDLAAGTVVELPTRRGESSE
jgi:integrase